MNEIDRTARRSPLRPAGPARATGTPDLVASLLSFAASLPGFLLAMSSLASFPVFIALHIGGLIVPATFVMLRVRRNGELTIPLLLLATSFACGPLGGLGCACMALAHRQRHPAATRLQDWYEYIAGIVARDRVARLYEELTSNRLHSDPAAQVPRFRPLLQGGSVEEQQRVLGVIGRRYHADFRFALRDALRNSNGFIRAQAAAVASRLGVEEKKGLWTAPELQSQDGAGSSQGDELH